MSEPSSLFTGLAELISLPKTGQDGEPYPCSRHTEALSQPSRRKVGSYVQRQTEIRNEVTPSGLSRHPP